MNLLDGKIITSLMISKDKQSLLFKTDGGDITAVCDADCCSFTWIEHIETPALGFPAKVISAQEIEMPDLGDMPDCDYVQYYGFKIVTNKGEIVIDYRNDSNGFYGGELYWPGEYSYGGCLNSEVCPQDWEEVTGDI